LATGHALRRRGTRELAVANRSPGAALALAAELDGRAVGLGALAAELARADIVVSSTEAPYAIVHRADVAAALAGRTGRADRPLALIDLAVPRDIDADVGTLPGVLLYDLDDLERAIEVGLERRRRDVAHAERIVDEEVARHAARRHALVTGSHRAAAPAAARPRLTPDGRPAGAHALGARRG
jgi:glutamyl-tRNA reductase